MERVSKVMNAWGYIDLLTIFAILHGPHVGGTIVPCLKVLWSGGGDLVCESLIL